MLRLLGMTGLGLVAARRPALAIGEASKFRFSRLDLADVDPDREGALPRLAWELNLRTSVAASYEIGAPDPSSAELYDYPFLYLGGDRSFPSLGDGALRQLRRHLELGGFLLIDDTSGHLRSEYDGAVRRELARLLPDAPLERLDDSHSIYRSYYLLRRLGGRVQRQPVPRGLPPRASERRSSTAGTTSVARGLGTATAAGSTSAFRAARRSASRPSRSGSTPCSTR